MCICVCVYSALRYYRICRMFVLSDYDTISQPRCPLFANNRVSEHRVSL